MSQETPSATSAPPVIGPVTTGATDPATDHSQEPEHAFTLQTETAVLPVDPDAELLQQLQPEDILKQIRAAVTEFIEKANKSLREAESRSNELRRLLEVYPPGVVKALLEKCTMGTVFSPMITAAMRDHNRKIKLPSTGDEPAFLTEVDFKRLPTLIAHYLIPILNETYAIGEMFKIADIRALLRAKFGKKGNGNWAASGYLATALNNRTEGLVFTQGEFTPTTRVSTSTYHRTQVLTLKEKWLSHLNDL